MVMKDGKVMVNTLGLPQEFQPLQDFTMDVERIQRLKAGPKVMGTKPDLEIMGLLQKEMGLNLAGGALCLVLYVRHARRVDHPIIDLALMRIPTYAMATTGGFLFRMGLGALPFLMPAP